MPSLSILEKALGYEFRNRTLLLLALTHRSYSAVNNERLEFLGDSIINFLIAETLYKRYSDYPEGKLSSLRSHLVKKQCLAKIALALNIGDFVLLGTGELKSGGHTRESIIANCVEAILAAIYCDSKSIQTCQKCVDKWYQTHLAELDSIRHLKDPKTRLQECLQSRKLPLPEYRLTRTIGKGQNLVFEISCSAHNLTGEIVGTGKNRRDAEQDAANKALHLIDNDSPDFAKK